MLWTTPWNTQFGNSTKYYICKSVLVVLKKRGVMRNSYRNLSKIWREMCYVGSLYVEVRKIYWILGNLLRVFCFDSFGSGWSPEFGSSKHCNELPAFTKYEEFIYQLLQYKVWMISLLHGVRNKFRLKWNYAGEKIPEFELEKFWRNNIYIYIYVHKNSDFS